MEWEKAGGEPGNATYLDWTNMPPREDMAQRYARADLAEPARPAPLHDTRVRRFIRGGARCHALSLAHEDGPKLRVNTLSIGPFF